MKTPSLNVMELLANPALRSKLSPEAQNWIANQEAFGKMVIYDFAKIVSGGSGIIKLFDEAVSKSIGVTNIEKAKFDSDFLLLGVGLFVATNTNEITDVRTQIFSNLGQSPADLTNDSDSTAAFVAQSVRVDRIPAAIRNGELRVVAGGNEILKAKADKFFVDAGTNQLGLNGDFANYFSMLNSPRLITKDKIVGTVLEVPAAIGNFFAIRVEYFGIEINQI